MPESNANEPNIDPRLMRLRVELFTALQTLKGDDLAHFKELVRDIALCGDIDVTHPDAKQDAAKPSGLDSGAAIGHGAAQPKSYASLIASVRSELLAKAEKLLEANNFDDACMLLNAYERVK